MLVLTFTRDLEFLDRQRAKGSDLSREDPAVLTHTAFLFPIRISVDEVELVGRSDLIYDGPLLGVAVSGLRTIRELSADGEADLLLSGDGWLRLERRGNEVEIYSTQTEQAAIVEYQELLEAWQRFADEIRRFVEADFPSLLENEYYRGWFGLRDVPPEHNDP